jgi:arsenite methyltransferase
MNDSLKQAVQTQYGRAANVGLSSDREDVRAVAAAFGYSAEQLGSIPSEANLGLSCGNPTAFASLQLGETVVDLGCGGGLDVFLAARKVGPAGRAIGIDMTAEMIALARRNAAHGADGQPITNVEFHLAAIDQLPLAAGSVDCILSNCVINLAPDKLAVFREMSRVLRPGGRLAVSDIALKQPLPGELAQDIAAYIGCIAGAISIADYRQGLAAAGFRHVEVVDTGVDLNAYALIDGQAGCCSPTDATCSPNDGGLSQLLIAASPPTVHAGLADLLARYNINDYAASVRVYAVKP